MVNQEQDGSNRTVDVVGIGISVFDQQMMVSSLPRENEKERALKMRAQVGGPVPTALVLLQRLGFSTHLISPWGTDIAADFIQRDLTKEGIGLSSACRGDRDTGQAHVWVCESSGSRTIVSHAPGWETLVHSPEDMALQQRCRILHTDGAGGSLTVAAAQRVRDSGGKVFVDAGSPKPATKELIPLASVFSFPERFAQQFYETGDTDAAGLRVLEAGADAAVCTLGERGARIYSGNDIVQVPAFSIKTVDSTGAGDVFCGGMISGLLEGESIVQSVRRGAAASAIKCRTLGNREALPTREQIQTLLASSASS